jgi:regulation of enolase protein 1 (concanavalin A-like superfamily)
MLDPEQPQPPRTPPSDPLAEPRPEVEPGAWLPGSATAAEPAPGQPRGRRRLLLILSAALGLFVACAAIGLVALVLLTPSLRSRLLFLNPVAAAPPEAPKKFADPPSGPVAISDDFSSASSRWDRSQTRIAGGAYELTLELDNFDSYGLFLGADNIADFDLAADVTLTAGPPDAEFGIRFRQSAPDEHLIFSISPSGFYRLARVSDKTYTSLVPWTRDATIATGVGATNRLRVVAEGPAITGYINGVEVLSYNDEQQQAGQLTLGLVTFEQGGLIVRFDNLEGFAISAVDGAEPLRVDLAQDFSDPAAVPWSLGGSTISAGAYEVSVSSSVITWQQPLPTGASTVEGDFALEVEATMTSDYTAGGGGGYGLMFGDGGSFDFFALLILPEGGITLFRSGADGGTIVPPIPVDTVNPGPNATNKIRIEVRGQKLTLQINDQPVTVNGEPFPELEFPAEVQLDGMAGVILQGPQAESLEARFDNFTLEELE